MGTMQIIRRRIFAKRTIDQNLLFFAMSSTKQLPTEVVVHPLVLLHTVDHYVRVAKDTNKRVVGILLGEVYKGRVDITNCYAGLCSIMGHWVQKETDLRIALIFCVFVFGVLLLNDFLHLKYVPDVKECKHYCSF
jgi:hypothetical protein